VFDNVVDLAVAGGLEQRSAVKKPGVTLFADAPALLAGRETEVT